MSNLIRQGDANLAAFGQFGYAIVGSGQAENTGKVIVAIQSLDDETQVTAKGEDTNFWPDISNLQLATGVTIFGRWKDPNGGDTISVSSVTGATGKVIVYYGE